MPETWNLHVYQSWEIVVLTKHPFKLTDSLSFLRCFYHLNLNEKNLQPHFLTNLFVNPPPNVLQKIIKTAPFIHDVQTNDVSLWNFWPSRDPVHGITGMVGTQVDGIPKESLHLDRRNDLRTVNFNSGDSEGGWMDHDGSVGPGDGEIFVDFCSHGIWGFQLLYVKKNTSETKQKNGPHKKGGPRTQQQRISWASNFQLLIFSGDMWGNSRE